MTENSNASNHPKTLNPSEPDGSLQLMAMTNGVPVTLNVSGLIISGTTIERHRYWPAVAATMSFLQPLADAVAAEPSPDNPDTPVRLPDFIHLTGARIWNHAAGPIPSDPSGSLWRGRITDVNGWWPGSLNASPSRDGFDDAGE